MVRRARSDRRAMLIHVITVIVTGLGVFLANLHHARSRNVKDLLAKKEKVQAQFLARGAQQHFLLKMKYLPAPFYEAAGYAAGRNPHYDFSVRAKSVTDGKVAPVGMESTNLGPLFFTGGSGTEVQASAGSLFVVRSKDPEIHSQDRHKMAFMLEHFLADVSSEYPPENPAQGTSPIVKCDSSPYSCKAMGEGWQDPFTGFYFVEDVKILAQSGGKKYSADCVTVTAEAQVRVYGQVSPVTGRSLDTPSRMTAARFETREGGWAELEFAQEDRSAYSDRSDGRDVGREPLASTASSRRTEIVTATYAIERSGVVQ